MAAEFRPVAGTRLLREQARERVAQEAAARYDREVQRVHREITEAADANQGSVVIGCREFTTKILEALISAGYNTFVESRSNGTIKVSW